MALLFLAIDSALKKHMSNESLENETSILILGDSHVVTAINDTIIQGSINIANHSEQYLFTYNKLLKILPENPQINTVFMGCSYHNFSNYLAEGIHEKSSVLNWLYVIPINDQLKIMSGSESPLHTFSTSLKSNIKQLASPGKRAWLGGYSPAGNTTLVDSNCIIERIQKQFYDENSIRSTFKGNIFYLDKIINLLQTKKISLKIIKTPLAAEYESNVPLKFRVFYDSIIKSNNLELVDFKNLLMVKEDFLPDGDHLSHYGAKKVSEYLQLFESNQH